MLLALLLCATTASAAQTYAWNGGPTGNWSTPANWTPTGVPGTGDSVVFVAATPAPATVDDLGAVSIASLTVADGCSITAKDGTDVLTITSAANFVSGASGITVGVPIVTNASSVTTLTDSGTGTVTIGGTVAAPNGIAFAGGNFAVSGVVSGVGTVAVSGGQVTMSGVNTYTGATTVSGGILVVDNTHALGATATGTTVSGTGAIQIGATATVLEPLTITTTAVPALSFVTTFNEFWNGPITLGVDTTIAVTSGYAAMIGGAIGESGGARKLSFTGGTITLTGTNTYSGGTDLGPSTTAQVSNSSAFGTGTVTVETSSHILMYATVNIANALVLNGAGPVSAATLYASNALSTWSGPITLNTADVTVGTTASPAAIVLGGAVSGPGALTKVGPSEVTLQASNSYAGTTTVQAGTLAAITGVDAIPNGSVVIVDLGATLTLGGDETIGGLAGSGTVLLGSTTLTLATPKSSSQFFAGTIARSGAFVSGQGVAGRLFTGANTYTGQTTINNFLALKAATGWPAPAPVTVQKRRHARFGRRWASGRGERERGRHAQSGELWHDAARRGGQRDLCQRRHVGRGPRRWRRRDVVAFGGHQRGHAQRRHAGDFDRHAADAEPSVHGARRGDGEWHVQRRNCDQRPLHLHRRL